MNRNQPTPEEFGGERGASEVAPPPLRDLPADRHQFHKARLTMQIDHDTRTAPPLKKRRSLPLCPILAWPALALVIVSAVGLTVMSQPRGGPSNGDGGHVARPVLADPNAGSPLGAVQRLGEMALVAATRDTVQARPGQFVYTKSSGSSFSFKDNAGTRDNAERQVWQSLDGRTGWLVTGAASLDDGESLDSDVPASLSAPSYDLLASLPTDPDALLAKIREETKGRGNNPDHQAFVTIGDLLAESYPPPPLYGALVKAAAKIPGVMIVDDAVDNAGRHGMAVAHVDTTNGEREELIFNRGNYTYLGSRIVMVQDKFGFEAGTVTVSTALLDRAVVDGMLQLPTHR